jgi:hypothetical protein
MHETILSNLKSVIILSYLLELLFEKAKYAYCLTANKVF